MKLLGEMPMHRGFDNGKSAMSILVKMLTIALLMALTLSVEIRRASAQERQPSTCLAIAQNTLQFPVIKAAFEPDDVRSVQSNQTGIKIRYATHSTFRIESPAGVVIATDYAGRAGSGRLPDIVTMNHAHGTHFTIAPDSAITHVLRGWGQGEAPASHYLEYKDTLTRNVASDIYRNGVLIEVNGNSIFIFEIAGLCIGHVGHLHHTLTPEHFAAIGRLDVLMVPVDGSVTMSVEGMANLARQFRSSVILPMHWFSEYSLQRFLNNMSAGFAIDVRDTSEMEVALNSLPGAPTVVVLAPELSDGFNFGD